MFLPQKKPKKRYIDDFLFFDNLGATPDRYTAVNTKLLRLKEGKFFVDIAYSSADPYSKEGELEIQEIPLELYRMLREDKFLMFGERVAFEDLTEGAREFFIRELLNEEKD